MRVSKVGSVPARNIKSRTDWKALADLLRANPGEAVLPEEFTKTERAESIRTALLRNPLPMPLRELGGTVTVSVRNSQSSREPRWLVGDVWVQWDPDGKEKHGE